MSSKYVTISVIGGSQISKKVTKLAYQAGQIVGRSGAVLVCGGLKGAMEAASHGAKNAGGMTIALLPGCNKKDANPYIDIALTTTIGFARNAMVACSADIIIALPGSHGTLSEICYGLVYKRPIIDLGGWKRKGMIQVKDLADAERKIKKIIKQIKANAY